MIYAYRCNNETCEEYSPDTTFDMESPVDDRDEQECAECGERLVRRITVPKFPTGLLNATHEKFDEFWATGDPDTVADHRDSAPTL